jgi:hypothetical protein
MHARGVRKLACTPATESRVNPQRPSGEFVGMVSAGSGSRWRPRFPSGITLLALAAGLLFAVCWLIDAAWFGQRSGPAMALGPLRLLIDLDAGTLQNELGALAQIIVAVLGIAITVVSIVVQLAATRYTPRIADMFFRDKTNLAIMGFFVVACLNALWVTLAVTSNYVPRVTIVMTLVLASTSILLLIPYFAYVFDFLDPGKVIVRIGQQVLDAAVGRRVGRKIKNNLEARQAVSVAAMEHLSDVAVNAAAQKDKIIASHATAALREAVVRYQPCKAGLPAEWFLVGCRIRSNPDFIAMEPGSLHEIERQQLWFEWKILRHFRSVFSESLNHLPEMAHVVAIETRYVGESALERNDRAVVATVLKYFNTYLRGAINSRDVRVCYNILNQYRLFAELLVRRGWSDLVLEIANRLAYYGQVARGAGMGFVTETSAHDLGTLCERAFELSSPAHDAMLGIFLEVDKEAESSADEKALRGVRKAQVKLATYYLVHGAQGNAQRICDDMADETPERLASIRAEMLRIHQKDFWEVTDRGVNFDYLDDARREKLDLFFDGLTLR